MMSEIIVLGSGTRVLHRERSMAGYAVRRPDFFMLLDCGGGAVRRGLEAALPMLHLDAILITHLHLDHVADLPELLWALDGEGEQRADRPLYLFGPPGFTKFFDGLSEVFGKWLKRLPMPLVVREVNQQRFSLGPWQVETLPMQHGAPANGYRLEGDGKILAYTGDTGFCEEVVGLAQNADWLIIECSFPNGQIVSTHLTAGEAGILAAKAACRRVLLTHFYPDCFAVDVAAQCREFFGGEIELAGDLKRLIL
ncbi:MAG: ribonuclease Z [candidate division KSB1 bacterium]|nr:ribonuclease Z [candidate division KSB1 bacterium]